MVLNSAQFNRQMLGEERAGHGFISSFGQIDKNISAFYLPLHIHRSPLFHVSLISPKALILYIEAGPVIFLFLFSFFFPSIYFLFWLRLFRPVYIDWQTGGNALHHWIHTTLTPPPFSPFSFHLSLATIIIRQYTV